MMADMKITSRLRNTRRLSRSQLRVSLEPEMVVLRSEGRREGTVSPY